MPTRDTLAYVDHLRAEEIEFCLKQLGLPSGKVLEIGGGTGQQALCLMRHFSEVVSVDLAGSEYAQHRVFDIVDYDGHRLPFADQSFDVVYSSNVLEHIAHLSEFESEMQRVLRPGGHAVHIVPTHAWRFWTALAHYPALGRQVWDRLKPVVKVESHRSDENPAEAHGLSPTRKPFTSLLAHLFDRRHGERGNLFTEHFYFRPAWWRRHFVSHGWQLGQEFPVGLFYTGQILCGSTLGLDMRRALASRLGSSTQCFCLTLPR